MKKCFIEVTSEEISLRITALVLFLLLGVEINQTNSNKKINQLSISGKLIELVYFPLMSFKILFCQVDLCLAKL